MSWLIRILVTAACLAWCRDYIKQNLTERIYEREIEWINESTGDTYGIGIRAEDGEIFWFHQKTEITTE